MKSDLSRNTFFPEKHYVGVITKQGSVDVDANKNEQQAIDQHHREIVTKDIIGYCGAPETEAGFRISIEEDDDGNNKITITRGRYYVDGILCENEVDITYGKQPDLPNPEDLLQLLKENETNLGLFYLDVWSRHITAIDDPYIREVALNGVETANRLKTVWQVKFLPVKNSQDEFFNTVQRLLNQLKNEVEALSAQDRPTSIALGNLVELLKERIDNPISEISELREFVVGELKERLRRLQQSDLNLETAQAIYKELSQEVTDISRDKQTACCAQFDEWDALITASTGQLNARTQPVPQEDNPCLLPPEAGYLRLENQLYRVEIHQGGDLGIATFKWSMDNGSVVTAIEAINGQEITVQSTGLDSVLGFASNQWVEISDDSLELHGKPGELLQIDDVNPATRIITLKSTPTITFDPSQHPKLRRWDSNGALPVEIPASNDGWIPLEAGIEVKFSAGNYQTGDYWRIPARSATGTIEWSPNQTAHYNPTPQFPEGIKHHYCRLALATLNQDQGILELKDCRRIFPPLATSSIHIISINWRNDDVMAQEIFSDGLTIEFDAPLVPESINAATMIVTLEVPSRVARPNDGDEISTVSNLPDFIFAIDGTITVDNNIIRWFPIDSQLTGLFNTFGRPLGINGPFLVRVTLKGHKIWFGDSQRCYLDGQVFGKLGVRSDNNRSPRTELVFPSGNGCKASDFESWFYLQSRTELLAG
ncbi:MAG: DUF6519 domain-containing protein [Cyanobacteria bacterium P01_D01_bin.116]